MSHENVELISRMYRPAEAMTKDDLLAALPELIRDIADPEIEWIEAPRVDRGTYRGHDGVRRAFHHWLDGFDEYSFGIEQILDFGDDVLVVAHEEGRGATSGVVVSATSYQLFTIRDGKVVRFRGFSDEASARQAAGLTE
jgi:uncharacterized protein